MNKLFSYLKFSFFLVTINLVDASLVAASEPNISKEQYFHKIFETYNRGGTDQSAWEQAIAARATSYEVQSGDTLWGISLTLFGDPNYWPKMWSVNADSIFNPHEISPQMRIKFSPGTMTSAPQVTLTNSGSGPEQMRSGSLVALPSQTDPSTGQFSWDTKNRPALKKLPPSIPEYSVFDEEQVQQVEFQLPPPPKAISSRIVSYYADVIPEEPLGEVVETEPGFMTAFTNQPVIVKLRGASSGRFLAISDEGRISSLGLDIPALHLIQVQGELEIGEVVNPEEGLYRATIKRAIFPVKVGSILVNSQIQETSTLNSGTPGSTSGFVIGGEYFNGRRALGLGSLVFLFSPEQASFNRNEILTIFPNWERRKGSTGVKINAKPIAKVRVVRSQGTYATGIVVQSDTEIEMMDSISSYRSPD